MSEQVTTIVIREYAADLYDWANPDGDSDEATVERNVETYLVTAQRIIAGAYPEAEVTVEAGETNGGTFIFVNDAQFGTFGSYNTDDHGEFDGAPQDILDLLCRANDEWPEEVA